jgi:flagellar hook-associated protein 2
MATTTTTTGVSSVDGLISGLNTTDIINQLAAIKRQPITRIQTLKTQRQQDLAVYQSLSAQLLAMRSSADALVEDDTFAARTAVSSDPATVAVSVSPGAATGAFSVKVEGLATTQKTASGTVADAGAALGFSGDIRLNGKTITVKASDTLQNLRDHINDAGAGVSASIVKVSATESHLMLTSLNSGGAGAVDAVDPSGILHSLGLEDGSAAVKHAITNGAAGDYLSSRTSTVGTALGLSRAPSGSVSIGGVQIALDLGTQTLDAIRQAISNSGAGVTASVVTDTSGGAPRYRLELTGAEGRPALTDSNHVLETLGLVKQAPADERTAARDAHIVVDNYDVYRPTNDISDAVSGVTLHLVKEDPGAAKQVTVSEDDGTTVQAVSAFVNSFNGVMDAINQGEQFNTDTNSGGTFFGDPMISLLQDRLHNAAVAPVATTGGISLMSQIGVSTDAQNHLVLDETKLRAALASDPEGVKRLFAVKAQTTSSEVQYVSAGNQTQASGTAGYAVHVTAPATQAQAVSAHLAGGIAQSETLTINRNALVTLSAGMTLTQARDAINLILVGNNMPVVASVEGDQLKLTHNLYGSAKTFEVRSSLAKGIGGTDLGGDTSAGTRIYAGTNIAGTINGEECEGYGQYLTGKPTAAHVAGLRLLITSATGGDKGTVRVSKGLGSRMDDLTLSATDATGTMTSATTAVQDDLTAMDAEMARLEDGVQTYITDMKTQFSNLEAYLSQQKAVSDYMTGQIASLITSYSNSSNSRSSN